MDRRFWVSHAALPLLIGGCLLFLFENLAIDLEISNQFYDPELGEWIYGQSWWAITLIHSGGKLLVAAVGLTALAVAITAAWRPRLRPLAPAAAYVAACLAVVPLLVGALKKLSGVPCPWDLQIYGGIHPYLHSFAALSSFLPDGGCFPGAHSAGGFALVCLYFSLRDRYPRRAAAALPAALGIGVAFAFGQLVRGAHFVSHDLTSALIAWTVALGLYAAIFRRWLAPQPRRAAETAPPPLFGRIAELR